MTQERRKAIGEPQDYTEQQDEEQSRVTDEIILAAAILWRANATRRYKTLLDAQPAGVESKSLYVWDERRGVYLQSGRVLPFREVKQATETVLQYDRTAITRLAMDLREGRITLAEWQTAMRNEIRALHTFEAAAARGGWAAMSPSDWGYTGNLIKEQYKYLDNFAKEIANGKQPLNGRFNVRADLYGKAGRGTYDAVRTRWEINSNGMEEERLVLGPAEHCQECLDDADLGWVPIGSLKPIGSRQCNKNCACNKEYRRMGADGQYITAEG